MARATQNHKKQRMKACIKNLFPLPALLAGLGLILATGVSAQTSDGMALIPAGSFTMGDTLDGESDAIPTVSVYVSAFYMDTNLVNYSQWQAVYNWATSHGYGFVNPGAGKAANHPVQMIDWYDCVKWCNARSQQAGLTPVYYTDAALTLVYTSGDLAPYVNWAASGYRLPTEAEFEKAARGGLSGQRFPWGNTISWSQANYKADPLSLDPKSGFAYDLSSAVGYDPTFNDGVVAYTSPVGYFAPNGYGLHDMAGNVWKWCWDWEGMTYAGGSDPHGPATGNSRTLRGGAWLHNADGARYAHRDGDYPTNVGPRAGLHCVRVQLAVPVTPVVLSAPQVTGSQTNFTFSLSGPAGSNCVLQVSTNLS
jgi:formylglycine-generating enzyme required for sulfatase activity